MPSTRRSVLVTTAVGAAALVTGVAPASAAPPVVPLEAAHAHNDYLHERPLTDALARGFTSVEADVHLVAGRLLVGHEPWALRPARTLQSLYLDPLRDRVNAGGGRVFPGRAEPLRLVVDVKSGSASTYTALDAVLASYADLLTSHRRTATGWSTRVGAVSVVVTGNRDVATMAAQRVRYAGYEGRAADLTGGADASLVPAVGDDWASLFRWRGSGPVPAAERLRLRQYVAQAHAAGREVRFWNTPDTAGAARTALWTELLAAGIDDVNTDDLDGLARFLRRTP